MIRAAALIALLWAAPATAQMTREMGGGVCNGGPAAESVVVPYHIAADAMGGLCLADTGAKQARRTQGSIIRLLAQFTADPRGIVCDGSGGAFVTTYQDRGLRAVEPSGAVRVLPTGGATRPHGVALGGGFLWFTDQESDGVYRCALPCVIGTTVQQMLPPGLVRDPQALAYRPGVGLYVTDTTGQKIVLLSTAGNLSTVAGTGARCDPPGSPCGDGGPASLAQLNFPTGVALAPDGTLYVADSGNRRVRRIAPSGTITTAAGTGSMTPPSSPQPAPGQDPTTFSLVNPVGVAAAGGTVYVADNFLKAVYSFPHDGTADATATITQVASTPTVPTATATATRTHTPSPIRTCNVPCV